MIKKNFILVLLLASYNAFGLTISESGEYVIGGPLTGTGDLLVIDADNVVLNIDGNIISGGTRGIVVNSGHTNIIIKNGTIENNTIGITINDSCDSIQVQDVLVKNCSNRGIEVLGSFGNEVENIFFSNISLETCATNGASADFAFSFTHTDEILVNNISITNGGSATTSFTGLYVEECERACFENVVILGNQGTAFQGILIHNCVSCFFQNCSVRSNTATGSFAGMRISVSAPGTGNVLTNCSVSSNVSTSGPLFAFDLTSGVTRELIRRCLANENRTTGAVSTANCVGFNLDRVTYCSLVENRAVHNRATGDGSTNYCAGFNIGTSGGGTTGTKDSEFFGNVAVSNNGFNDRRSFGFRVMSNKGGNEDNIFILNYGMRNGPNSPDRGNQITSTSGSGSSPGGVPNGSLRDRNISNLNFDTEYGNLRVI